MTIPNDALRDLIVGVHPGGQSLFILRASGLLERFQRPTGEGRIFWREFRRAWQLPELLAQGEIHVAGSGSMPAFRALEAGMDLALLGASLPRPAFCALVAPAGSSIRGVADLPGRKVAIMLGSWHEHFLAAALERIGAGLPDLRLVDRGEEAEAWIVSGEDVLRAEANPELRFLADPVPDLAKAGLWRGNRALLFGPRAALEARSPLVEDLLKALAESDAATARDAGFAAQAFVGTQDAEAVDLHRRALARLPWGFHPADEALRAELQRGADILARQGVLSRAIDLTEACRPLGAAA